MSTLAVDKKRVFETEPEPVMNDLPCVASDIVYEGAAAGDTVGTIRPLVAGDPFRGFCARRCDNSLGAASALQVLLRTRGIVTLAVTGVASEADIGKEVYASDDDTFTLSPSGNSLIGRIHRWVSSTTAQVSFDASRPPRTRPPQVTKTADYALTAADHGTEFNNLGAAGTVIFTCPAASAVLIGTKYTIRAAVAAQLVRVACMAGEMITFNNAAATSVTFGTSSEIIGGEFEVTCISATKWFVSIRAEETQTVTVA